ncbi:MAG TPA: hypothetical protein VMF30_07950, partial [Pirellulales bacterium]|nr:hypothetical protein [Pirellulales bacterium]
MNERSLPADHGTLLSRVLQTPLGDLARGRITGRRDVRSVIAAAGLPAPLADLIRGVARRTRLWRSERLDVARELADHFRDGLATGRTADELIAAFGDPRQAARLIRRAKLRARPLRWRIWRRGVQVLAAVAALVVGCYAWLGLNLITHHPNIARNYQLELIAPTQGVAEADRAWPFYRQALLALTPWPVTTENSAEPTANADSPAEPGLAPDAESLPSTPRYEVAVTAERPGSRDWPLVIHWLDENREAIELARQGATCPRLGFVYDDPADAAWLKKERYDTKLLDPSRNNMAITLQLPHCQSVRYLAYLLTADARRATAAGDRQAFTADAAAIIGMAEQVHRDIAVLVDDLISYAVLENAIRVINEALAARPEIFIDDDFAILAHRLAAYAGGGPIVPHVEGERAVLDDVLQRMYSDNGHGDGVLTSEGLHVLEGLSNVFTNITGPQLAYLALTLPAAQGIMSRKEVTQRADAF